MLKTEEEVAWAEERRVSIAEEEIESIRIALKRYRQDIEHLEARLRELGEDTEYF